MNMNRGDDDDDLKEMKSQVPKTLNAETGKIDDVKEKKI